MPLKELIHNARLSLAGKPMKVVAQRFEGQSRIVTALSCGVRDGAAPGRADGTDASADFRVVNAVMAPLLENAVNAGGMVSPFLGFSFTAAWNAETDDPEHAMRACEAASRMVATAARIDEQLGREHRSGAPPLEPIAIDIGISTGPAIAGEFTASRRTSNSVIGANVVLAGRLQALADRYGHAVIVSEAARQATSRDFAFLELDFLALGPGEAPVRLYAMLGNPLTHANPKYRALATFHDRIFACLRAQQWDDTRRLIEQCRKLSGASQKLYDFHLARVAWFETHPPGPDWDGAFRPPIV